MPASTALAKVSLPSQLEREPAAQYDRFTSWLTASEHGGRRSYEATAREFGIDGSTIREAARKYEWLARGIAYDRARVLKSAAKVGELQAQAAVSHVSLAQDLVDQCQRALRQGDALLGDEPDFEALDMWQRLASGIGKTLDKAAKIARLAMGQSDSNQSIIVTHKTEDRPVDYSRLSDDELQLSTIAYWLDRKARGEQLDQRTQEHLTQAAGAVARMNNVIEVVAEAPYPPLQGESTDLAA